MIVENLINMVFSVDKIKDDDVEKIRITLEPVIVGEPLVAVGSIDIDTTDKSSDKTLIEITNEIMWNKFSKGNGSWTFTDNPIAQPLLEAIQKNNGQLKIENRNYKLTGEEQKFISRFPA